MNSTVTHNTSVYIPSIVSPTGHNVDIDYIIYLFENIWDLGSVNRVDIFDVVNSNGKRAGNKRGAFIHMNSWENNSSTELILEEIMQTGQCQLWLTNNTNNGRGCYWILKKMNREPIKETELNVHQLADKLREMQELIAERDAQIAEHDAQIAECDAQIAEHDAQIAERDAQIDALIKWRSEIVSADIWKVSELNKVDDSKMTIDYELNEKMTIDEINSGEYARYNIDVDVDDSKMTIDELNTAVDYGHIDDSKMIVDELNVTNHNSQFEAGLDISTRKQFTSHLCNN
jgi:hypothetical protein